MSCAGPELRIRMWKARCRPRETRPGAGSYGQHGFEKRTRDHGAEMETTMIARMRENRGTRIAMEMAALTAAYVLSLVGFAYLMA